MVQPRRVQVCGARGNGHGLTERLYNTICYVEQQSVEDKFHMFAQQKQEQILHILLRFLVHCVAKLQAERHVVRLEKEGLENKI